MLSSCKHENKAIHEIPFIYSGNLYVECSMYDSIQGNFVFDTGADGFILDSTFERRKIDKKQFYILSNDPSSLSNFMKIKIGGMNFYPKYLSTMNCRKSLGRFIDGIVGWDLFEGKVIKIDFINDKIIVFDPEGFEIEDGFESIPLTFKNERIYLKAELATKEIPELKGDFLLDLGSQDALCLTGGASNFLKLDSAIRDQERFIMYNATLYDDTTTGGSFRAETFRVGGLEMPNIVCDYVLNEHGVTGDTDYMGLIGVMYFEKFETYIDFKNRVLYLKPNEGFNERMQYKYVGFVTNDQSDIYEGATIKGLFKGSNAEKAGIKCGDLVTHINGNSVKTFTLGQRIFTDMNKDYEFALKRKDSSYKFKTKVVYK